jgi:hypothetical protein
VTRLVEQCPCAVPSRVSPKFDVVADLLQHSLDSVVGNAARNIERHRDGREDRHLYSVRCAGCFRLRREAGRKKEKQANRSDVQGNFARIWLDTLHQSIRKHKAAFGCHSLGIKMNPTLINKPSACSDCTLHLTWTASRSLCDDEASKADDDQPLLIRSQLLLLFGFDWLPCIALLVLENAKNSGKPWE